jgi:hypothetical protein
MVIPGVSSRGWLIQMDLFGNSISVDIGSRTARGKGSASGGFVRNSWALYCVPVLH